MSKRFARLFENGTDTVFGKDRPVFHLGDPVRFMFLTVEGQVSLVRHTKAGMCMVLQRAGSGGVLAEASAYSEHYHCSAVADMDSVLRVLPVAVFLRRLKDDSDLANAWASHLAHSVQRARLDAEIRTLRTVAERLDAWLGEERILPAKGRLQDLAHELGVTREALYRELARRRKADPA